MRGIAAAACFFAGAPAFASWHYGTITHLAVGYDGSTVALILSGFSRTDCSCYSTWPMYMCLDRTRTSFREEYAQILSAKRADAAIGINIDEATCRVVSVSEEP